MAKVQDLKRGNAVRHDGKNWSVREVERSAPTGRGGNTTYRFALYSIPEGLKLDLSFRADDDLEEIELLRREANFSYRDGDDFVFLDAEDYTSYVLSPDAVGELELFMTDKLDGAYVLLIDDVAVGLRLPQMVELTVVDTPPFMRGASATGRGKTARLDSGLEIQVPEYLGNGERVRINTETREFAGRAD